MDELSNWHVSEPAPVLEGRNERGQAGTPANPHHLSAYGATSSGRPSRRFLHGPLVPRRAAMAMTIPCTSRFSLPPIRLSEMRPSKPEWTWRASFNAGFEPSCACEKNSRSRQPTDIMVRFWTTPRRGTLRPLSDLVKSEVNVRMSMSKTRQAPL